MNLVQYLHAGMPFTNIPDLLNLHHGNPLGLGILTQLIIIFVVVEAMAVFNYFIRYRGKSQYYPVLYTLLFVALVSIYYYCFQDGLPMTYVKFATTPRAMKPCIGWFCQYSPIVFADGHTLKLSLGVIIVNILLLLHVIYSIVCGAMQVAAQLSVEAKMIEGKKWKEWKVALFIALAGVAAYGISYYINPYLSAWVLLIFQFIIIGFVIYKIIADSLRCRNFLWGLLIGIVVYAGFLAAMMLAMECLRGLLFSIVLIISFLSMAKARKKQPKKAQ